METSVTTKKSIFKKGSITYYYSSLFFPKKIRDDVFTLYAFVRTADDYIDSIPQDAERFHAFEKETWKSFKGDQSKNHVIQDFVSLVKRKNMNPEWVKSFFTSMKQDLTKHTYYTYAELEQYMYGSAEIVGLMMSCIFSLPKKAWQYAQLQGRAMQMINFIRDIQEDSELGRKYIPEEDFKRFNVTHLPPRTDEERLRFKNMMIFEIERYEKIQKEASKGYQFIPPRLRIPVVTAADMYTWTAKTIKKNPFIVFEKKVKPSAWFVIYRHTLNSLRIT